MNDCPCCSGLLIRHIRHDGVYWFCPSCWQEMPNFTSELTGGAGSSRLKLERLLKASPLDQFSGKLVRVG